MLKTAIERARFQDNVGSCCVRLYVAKSLTAFKLNCATTRNNWQQHRTKLRPFAPGFKQPQRQRQKKLHLHWKASSSCFKLYRLQVSSPIWAREASRREPTRGQGKELSFLSPAPRFRVFLSRASREFWLVRWSPRNEGFKIRNEWEDRKSWRKPLKKFYRRLGTKEETWRGSCHNS